MDLDLDIGISLVEIRDRISGEQRQASIKGSQKPLASKGIWINTIMYNTSKKSENLVDSDYEKSEGFGSSIARDRRKRRNSFFQLCFFIMYTIRFVKMRRIQRY